MAEESSSSSVNGGQHHAPPLNKGYQNDILNPYFMHPNENPGNVLATPLLSGPNYHSWTLLHKYGKSSKIVSIKVIFFESLIFKKKFTCLSKVIVLFLLIIPI
jgi:hypothetical protein